jgi:hypothetical protein
LRWFQVSPYDSCVGRVFVIIITRTSFFEKGRNNRFVEVAAVLFRDKLGNKILVKMSRNDHNHFLKRKKGAERR